MAKFTSQEVSALQGGGNASAKEIYFKEWDPQRHSFPDSGELHLPVAWHPLMGIQQNLKGRITNSYSGESNPSSFQCKSTGVGPFGIVSSSICSSSNCWNTWSWSGCTCKQLNNFPPVSAQVGAPVGHTTMSPFGVGAPATATTNNLTTFPSGGAPAAAPGSATAFPSNGGQWPTMLPQQLSLLPATGFQPNAHTFTPPVSGPSSYQVCFMAWLWPPSIPAAQTSQAVSKQPSPPEVKPSGRKELPEDLFAPTSPSSAPYPGWKTGPPQGYGFNMQYNPAVSMQMFPHSSKLTNPFDVNNEVSPVQVPTISHYPAGYKQDWLVGMGMSLFVVTLLQTESSLLVEARRE
ncbi:NSP (nuclear shuttle protein)-interacting GTPase [Actinidia rufa]|uniref:NSP (Nuclear shuttle protein)-interacting GTPase n=1 Tax=Actinidia rufa TaxID=165716 RepID=A0A7J0E7N2_9ERIC|nr:NSP (nuclear shuttle protein)-interacting GTPase [Actinidia rufa]